ncbi:Sterol 3-beta-glucosyltransferase [Ancylobacter novellus DSM 506]|uniref:Sterol 3-beta-glucosyltransferase n=1 Tax=Ancylobacter novellus (strain ATCC 8093 / DSM 506 / JCM 20403 / CCM 1077 / IAM 12100 / NBRC 12443 / NCIMB 10456) TaxID=639283 RepID=D7A8J5_ANCN5|nr:glycosyltransferase [Ancylobacter novellus]ADH90529.1 Sterol 3-beta-glucosyltransferase [Ancylobacter novellus DSM 506]
MRIAIHVLGTRGDVQPYLALSRGLRLRGHEVLLVAPAQFAGMAEAENLAFAPLPGDFLALLETPEARAVIGKSRAGFGAGFKLIGHYRHLARGLLDAEWEAARAFHPDAILFHPKALGAPHIAERLGVPLFLASPLPGFTPTAAFPTPLLPVRSLGPLNRASHALMIHGGNVLFSKTIRTWRAETFGSSGRSRRPPLAGTLYGYSPQVIPKPSDWGPDIAVCGYWFLDMPNWNPDTDLAGFLRAGEPPIYVGFGSMPGTDPEGLTRLVIEGLRRAGRRGLLATGGGALGRAEAGERIHFIAGAPHDRLFPLMHATLHHGGAGTTGAALRAGKPMAICPFLGDQPLWARRIEALGVGTRPLDKRRMTADDLATAFRSMDHPAMRTHAEALGIAIRSEDGIGTAVSFIEERLTRAKPGASAV